MRILYVVHRYGQDIVGGAETACRFFAENLVLRGHHVEVLTSCAKSYIDWEDFFPPGAEEINGVKVHRLQVLHKKDLEPFLLRHHDILNRVQSATLAEQLDWLDAMGPLLKSQDHWLRSEASRFDAVIFMTYLYPTTAYGIPFVRDLLPVVLQPTAHDETPIYLSYYTSLMNMADAFIFLTPEEKEVVRSLLGHDPVGVVTGIGMPIDETIVNPTTFRAKWSLGDDPYLIYVGRIDTMKGIAELMRFFVEYKGRNPGPMKLVLAGDAAMEIPDYEGFVHVGFLSEQEKKEAIAGAMALVQPSPFESFSIVLCEGWLQRIPAIVRGRSEALSGQVLRSEGGLPYTGFAEFEACVNLLLNQPRTATDLGESGYRYVVKNYAWDSVIDKVEESLQLARERFRSRH